METTDCLNWISPEKVYGSSILRIATQFAYVHADTRVLPISEAFNRHPDLLAVAITDKDDRTIGLLTRSQLFSLLGKPFGREIIARKQVSEIAEEAQFFDKHTNLFQVASSINDEVIDSKLRFFLLSDNQKKFGGIFSSKDLLVFLSRMTQDDIELGSRLQERMVKPLDSWQAKGWQAHAFSKSAKGVGGDFHFHKELGDDKHFFAIGDVSGKGVAASILTSLLWGILTSFDYRRGLRELLMHLNESLIRTFQLEKYLTGLFLVYDRKKQQLKIADMGHGHAAVVRNGTFRALQLPGLNLPLGIELGIEPQIFRLKLVPGDLIISYTDGITEQENASGSEFGEENLTVFVTEHLSNPDTIPGALLQTITEWRGNLPQHDDMTWLQLSILDKE